MKIPASHDLLLPFYFLTAWSEYTPTASVHLRLAAFVYLFSLYPGLFDGDLVYVVRIDRKNVAVEYDEACFEACSGTMSAPLYALRITAAFNETKTLSGSAQVVAGASDEMPRCLMFS